MRGRNWKIIVSIIIGILIIGIMIYLNRKSTSVDDGDKVTDAPLEQKTEQQAISPSLETQETDQVTSTPVIIEPSVTPTPTRRVYHITNPPTEAPTPIPPTATPDPWKETEYPPTCEEAGYIIRENTLEGYTVIDEGKPALGHEHGEWKQDRETGMYITTCIRCGKEIEQRVPYDGTIPRIDLTGSMDGISKSDRVTLQFDFASPFDSFTCYSYTTWQGHSTLQFPKKNYTIRLFDDEELSEKHKLIFKGWRREHKYILKANYRDVSQVRNLVAANLWADMAKTRPNLYEGLRSTSNFGAVDGFPVVVYLNREFLGLYTMNLHIDDDLYQMDNEHDVVMITNSTEPDECRFLTEASFTDQKNAWEVEFCGTGEDDQWAKDKLNEMIRFVRTSDDETFRIHLKDYLDVDGAIDYLIFLYVTGLKNNAVKDLVLLKYHDCDTWIPSVYDMEGAFGLDLSSLTYTDADVFLPIEKDGLWSSRSGSLLWDRVLQMFGPELRTRYAELRRSILMKEYLVNCVNRYLVQIPEEFYKQDLDLYSRRLPEQTPQEQIVQFIEQRISLLDAIWQNNEQPTINSEEDLV